MIVHKNFNEADFDNDLAVLELKFPVDFSDKVVPICLPGLYPQTKTNPESNANIMQINHMQTVCGDLMPISADVIT